MWRTGPVSCRIRLKLSGELSEELEVLNPLGPLLRLESQSPGALHLEPSAFSDAQQLSLAAGDCLLRSGGLLSPLAALSPLEVCRELYPASFFSPQRPGLAAEGAPSRDLASEVVTRWPSVAGAV